MDGTALLLKPDSGGFPERGASRIQSSPTFLLETEHVLDYFANGQSARYEINCASRNTSPERTDQGMTNETKLVAEGILVFVLGFLIAGSFFGGVGSPLVLPTSSEGLGRDIFTILLWAAFILSIRHFIRLLKQRRSEKPFIRR